MNIHELQIKRVSGAGSSSPFFHLMTKDNFYVGMIQWNSQYKYWQVGCDEMTKEEKCDLIHRVQANIFKHKPEEYRECGMPEDPGTTVLGDDWWKENREKVMDSMGKKNKNIFK